MIEAYKISANLSITGDANKKMAQFASSLQKSSERLKTLTNTLKTFNTEFVKLSAKFQKIEPLFSKLNLGVRDLKSSMTPLNESFTGFNRRALTTENRLKKINTQAESARVRLNMLGQAGISAGNGLAHVAAGGMGGGGRRGKSGLKQFGAGVAGGFGLYNPYMMAGFGAAGMVYSGFNESSQYEQELNQFKSQGFTQAETNKVDAFARNTSIKGITKRQILKAVVDGAMATLNTDSAIELAPKLAKIEFANKVNFHKEMTSKQGQDLVQFAEMRGGSDAKKVSSSLDLGERIFNATGGRMGFNQLLNMQKMASVAFAHLSDAGYLKMAVIAQEANGHIVGTGAQTGFNRLITGRGLGGASGQEGLRIGLLDRHTGKGSNILTHKQPILKKEYEKILQEDLAGFILDVVNPKLEKMGFLSDMDKNKEYAILFDRTMARDASLINRNRGKIEKAVSLHGNAYDAQQAYDSSEEMQARKLVEFKAAFADLSLAFGDLQRPYAIKGLSILTEFINNTAQAARLLSHPLDTFQNATKEVIDGATSQYRRITGTPSIDLNTYTGKHRNQMIQTQIHIDGKKIIDAISTNLASQSQNSFGQSGNNSLYVPTNTDLSYPGFSGGYSQ